VRAEPIAVDSRLDHIAVDAEQSIFNQLGGDRLFPYRFRPV
jgi:hypothetical protein